MIIRQAVEQPPATDDRPLADRITAYLASGGLFNPEMAIHDRVRDLLIECREALSNAEAAHHDDELAAAYEYSQAMRQMNNQELAREAAEEIMLALAIQTTNHRTRVLKSSHLSECKTAPRGEHEWTRESVLAIAKQHIGADAISDAVSDAHNAALAAEREKRKPLVEALELLEYDENGHVTAWPSQKVWADALAKVKE